MVLCFDVVDIEMYNPMSNRHMQSTGAVQNFALHAGHYAAAAAAAAGFAASHHGHASMHHQHQQSSQFAAAAAAGVSVSSPAEINCPVAAQYHQMAEVHQGLMHQHQHQQQQQQQQQQQVQQQVHQQQQQEQQQTMQGGGGGNWPSTMSYSMSSCARTVGHGHGHMSFEEWAQAGSQPVQQLPQSASSPNSTVSLSPPHHVPSCHYAAVSAAAAPLPLPSSSSYVIGKGLNVATTGDYSTTTTAATVTTGHHSPDSGLTSCSDGVSSSGSPHQQQSAAGATAAVRHAAVSHPLPFHHHHHLVHLGHSTTPGSAVVQQVTSRPAPVRSPFEWMKSKSSSYQNHPNPGKTRTKDKYRVVYSDHQRLELEKEFHYSRYITIRRKAELAQMLGLSERQVKIWFQNRRAKERKQGKKRDDLKPSKEASLPPQLAHQSSAASVVLQQQHQQQLHGHHPTTALLHHHHHHHHLQASNALMTTAANKIIHLD